MTARPPRTRCAARARASITTTTTTTTTEMTPMQPASRPMSNPHRRDRTAAPAKELPR